MLALGESAGCACKADWSVVEALRQYIGSSADASQLGLLDASSISPFLTGLGVCVATIDFIGPVSRTPEDFGAVAAAHALSDLYAVGAAPRCALVVAAWPRDPRLEGALKAAVEALTATAMSAGCVILGGHTSHSDQPLLGLSAIGERITLSRKQKFRDGDLIYITKPLGSGIAIGATKDAQCSPATEEHALRVMRDLNISGLQLHRNPGVKLVTDITGFGLAGQLLRLAKLAQMSVCIESHRIPLIEGVGELARRGIGTHAAERNWGELKNHIDCQYWLSMIVACDPQTNGPLLFVADADFERELDCTYCRIGTISDRQGMTISRPVILK